MFTNLATNLSDTALKEIQLLEKEIGYPILAFSIRSSLSLSTTCSRLNWMIAR